MFKSLFSASNSSTKKVGFEDVKYAIENHTRFFIINTLPNNEQDVLIQSTMKCENEEKYINDMLSDYTTANVPIIVYGRNSSDDTVERKYKQLCSLGFNDVYIYYGGLFEWLLLQDIYGMDEFPTSKKVGDMLKYKPKPIFPL
jgi:hypothetical protein